MMKFYDELSRVYDIVFPENRAATEYLSKGLTQGQRILDLASGTGIYSNALAQKGYEVVGIEIDEEMIKKAKEKYPESFVTFIAGNMLDIDILCDTYQFDMVFCIGNSLVHLPDRDSVKELAEKVHGLLFENGVFIVQTVNFDRILKFNIDTLPPIHRDDEGVKLIRKYGFESNTGYISFNTELIINGKITTNSVKLLALRSEELIRALETAGFSGIRLYGTYDESDYTDESPAVILKAVKKR